MGAVGVEGYGLCVQLVHRDSLRNQQIDLLSNILRRFLIHWCRKIYICDIREEVYLLEWHHIWPLVLLIPDLLDPPLFVLDRHALPDIAKANYRGCGMITE